MRTSTSNAPINLGSARVFQVCHASFSPKVLPLPQCYFLNFSLSLHSLSLPPSLCLCLCLCLFHSDGVSPTPTHSFHFSLHTHTQSVPRFSRSFFLSVPHPPALSLFGTVQFARAAVRINSPCMWEKKKEEKNFYGIKMDFFYAHMQTTLVLPEQTQACLIKHSCLVRLRGDTFGLCKILHLCHFVRLKSGARHPTPCFHYRIPIIGTSRVQRSSMGVRDGWFR